MDEVKILFSIPNVPRKQEQDRERNELEAEKRKHERKAEEQKRQHDEAVKRYQEERRYN
jgi:predicted phage gp36 major capsid-like protein